MAGAALDVEHPLAHHQIGGIQVARQAALVVAERRARAQVRGRTALSDGGLGGLCGLRHVDNSMRLPCYHCARPFG